MTKTISSRAWRTISGVRACLLLLVAAAAVWSQTTQGLISGQLVDSVTGRPIAAANVIFASATAYPGPVTTTGAALTQVDMLAPPGAVSRTLAIERLDYNTPDGKNRAMVRVLINRLDEPDFIWSPYKAFISSLHENTISSGGSYIHAFQSNLTNEARLSSYNVLNHANLGNPDARLNDPQFGVATYGRQGYPSGFPAVAPLNETPREIQMSVRVVF